jgi:hypothetical protein
MDETQFMFYDCPKPFHIYTYCKLYRAMYYFASEMRGVDNNSVCLFNHVDSF